MPHPDPAHADPARALAGKLILVVEDEVLIAMMLEDVLHGLGCRVALAGSIAEALHLLGNVTPDGVLLDMNIHGVKSTPVAAELASRSVPFLLVTGYGALGSEPPEISTAPRIQKPFRAEVLYQRMVEVFAPAG